MKGRHLQKKIYQYFVIPLPGKDSILESQLLTIGSSMKIISDSVVAVDELLGDVASHDIPENGPNHVNASNSKSSVVPISQNGELGKKPLSSRNEIVKVKC